MESDGEGDQEGQGANDTSKEQDNQYIMVQVVSYLHITSIIVATWHICKS